MFEWETKSNVYPFFVLIWLYAQAILDFNFSLEDASHMLAFTYGCVWLDAAVNIFFCTPQLLTLGSLLRHV